MGKHSSRSSRAEAAADGIDSSTPPLAQVVKRAESVVEVARKAKRKHASRGSNKQRPVNFMPDIIRMYRDRVMDDVRADCALKSNASAYLNEFASHRLRVLKANTDRTIASRKHDTLSVADVLAHVKLSMYADKPTQERALRFVKKAVANFEASMEKEEHDKYLRDKADGKDVQPRDKRSRSDKALAKKKAKEEEKKKKKKANKQKEADDDDEAPVPMDEEEDEEEEEEEEEAAPARKSGNVKEASSDAEKEDDADVDDGTGDVSPTPSNSADEASSSASDDSASDNDEEEAEA